MYFGIYSNGVLITDTEREFAPCPTTVTVVAGQVVITCSGTDVITFRIYMHSSASFGKIHNGNIEYTQLSASDIYQISAIDKYTTNMTTPAVVYPLEVTPTTSGNKLILVEFSYYITRNYDSFHVGLYKNGVLLSGTAKTLMASSLERQSLCFQYFDDFLNTDQISVRVYVDDETMNVVINGRNMCVLNSA
jgi:hypothetical protein